MKRFCGCSLVCSRTQSSGGGNGLFLWQKHVKSLFLGFKLLAKGLTARKKKKKLYGLSGFFSALNSYPKKGQFLTCNSNTLASFLQSKSSGGNRRSAEPVPSSASWGDDIPCYSHRIFYSHAKTWNHVSCGCGRAISRAEGCGFSGPLARWQQDRCRELS